METINTDLFKPETLLMICLGLPTSVADWAEQEHAMSGAGIAIIIITQMRKE